MADRGQSMPNRIDPDQGIRPGKPTPAADPGAETGTVWAAQSMEAGRGQAYLVLGRRGGKSFVLALIRLLQGLPEISRTG